MNEILPFIVRFVATAVWCLAAMLGVALAVGTVAYCGERLRRLSVKCKIENGKLLYYV